MDTSCATATTRDGNGSRHVARLTMNRPESRNKGGKDMRIALHKAFGEVLPDPEIRAVILTGAGGHFSAGGDITEFGAFEVTEQLANVRGAQSMIRLVLQSQKPVIAAVEGFCITGGWELAMACDIRVAGEGASFLLTGSRIGTVPGGGGTQRLPREVGLGRALEIHFAAEPIDGKEAYRIGAVNRLVAKGQALAEAKKMIRGYEKRAPLSLAMAKRAVRAGMQMDMKSAIEYERFLVSAVYGTEDRREGIAAFLEKRDAVFKGR